MIALPFPAVPRLESLHHPINREKLRRLVGLALVHFPFHQKTTRNYVETLIKTIVAEREARKKSPQPDFSHTTS